MYLYTVRNTAVIQLLLPVPLLVAMVRGRAPASDAEPHPGRVHAMAGLVVLMMAVSVYGQLVRGSLL